MIFCYTILLNIIIMIVVGGKCPAGQFQCLNHQCIPEARHCDGHKVLTVPSSLIFLYV